MKLVDKVALGMGTPAFILFIIFAGWKVALCLFFILWADNLSQRRN